MKDILPVLLVNLALALVAGVIFTVWLIGAETMKVLAGMLVGGLLLIGLVAAAALPIRAWKKNDAKPIEKQVIREVRILDGRPAPVPQLPPPQQPPFGVFPELLRAAYQSGQLSARSGEAIDAAVRELPADGWDGDITA